MSIYSHNVYDSVRTRVIVLHDGKMLLLEPAVAGEGWQVPGGGLEQNESLFLCGEREVFEETRVRVQVTGVAFLREFVVPRFCVLNKNDDRVAYGLEVFLYAHPPGGEIEPQIEGPGHGIPHWIGLEDVPHLPLWPKELKTLAQLLAAGLQPTGVPSVVSQLESPHAPAPEGLVFR